MRRCCVLFVMTLLLTVAVAQNPPADLVRDAEAGNPADELKLANAYRFGNGAPKDVRQSIQWLRQAVHDGSGEAAYILGTLAYNGETLGDDVQASLEEAWAWFEIAKVMKYPEAAEAIVRLESEMAEYKIKQGHELAADMLADGRVTPSNPSATVIELDWLHQHGTKWAALRLGNAYREGSGVPKDLAKARELCREALKKHLSEAGVCLGKVFDEQGDQQAAFKYFEQGAHLGDVLAVIELAQRLKDGRETKADPVEALAWIILAESRDVEMAKDVRPKFAEGLTEQQLAKANGRVEALKKIVEKTLRRI